MPVVDGHDAASIERALQCWSRGEPVAFPTETVYGLGAPAEDDAAVARVFSLKGRPADHPLIVHVASLDDAAHFGDVSAPVVQRLTSAFWPGPLTVIVPRRAGVAAAAAGGHASVGLRMPAHPVARALLSAAAARGIRGVAAPSANRFGRVSPTRAAHVADEFGAELLVLDGGACAHGIESAIVDATRGAPALLRPGTLDRTRLEHALGAPLAAAGADAPRASGTLASHYAPAARVRLMDAKALRTAFEVIGADGKGLETLAVYSRSLATVPNGVVLRRMPDDPAAAAHELFDALRSFDAGGARLVWIESPPAGTEWDGVRDRLARAAA